MGVVLHAHFVCGESHIQHNDNSSDSLTRVNDSSRVTNFDDSDSTRVTLRKIVTRIDSSHVFYKMTRLESQSMARDSSQSHFCKISEPLIDKPSLFAYQEIIIFLVQEWSKLVQIFCFDFEGLEGLERAQYRPIDTSSWSYQVFAYRDNDSRPHTVTLSLFQMKWFELFEYKSNAKIYSSI